jgi:hypothetical protein
MKLPLGPLRALVDRLVVGWFTRKGRRCLDRGDLRGATKALERALRRKPDAFQALLHLSRAYLRARDLFRAHRTLARAREVDPRRFPQEAARWVSREGYQLEEVTPSRPAARAPQPAVARTVRRPSSTVLRYGDCRDLDEYARFRAMPPISRAEIDDCDWDSVLDDLLDE